jgi:hypothetical protein
MLTTILLFMSHPSPIGFFTKVCIYFIGTIHVFVSWWLRVLGCFWEEKKLDFGAYFSNSIGIRLVFLVETNLKLMPIHICHLEMWTILFEGKVFMWLVEGHHIVKQNW